jgi:Ca-activated chloride channel homolog
MRRSITRAVLLVSVCLMGALSVSTVADGVILPDNPEWGWLSVVNHDVEITIRDGVATTHIDQLFRNDSNRDIEGQYVFPLPPGAVISSFTMWVNGEALEAAILGADEARAIYEDFVRRAIDPALLEYIGRDTVSARIFPIPAGGERRIEITYTELLSAEAGTYRYRYPLDTERFSALPLERVSIVVDLETSIPLKAVYSPSHSLELGRWTEMTASVRFEDSNVRPTEDFFLYYSVSPDDMGMTLLTYRSPDEDGFFMLIVTPPDQAGSETAIPKDLVFVLDTSGSMGGDKIVQAKEALRFILDNLNPDDRFAVIAFSDYNEALQTQLTSVTPENIGRAKSWVSNISAGGGTNIDDALLLGFSLFEDNERPQFLVFLTDGEPTVGEQNPVTIAAHAVNANATGARLFSFGVGNNVNTVLLDQLTQENRGTTTYVLPGENLEVSVSSFYRKIASPVLADITLAIEGLEVFDIHPVDFPDIFRGTQLLILGRYRGDGDALVTLAGNSLGIQTSFVANLSFSSVSLEDGFLARLWAGRKISYLLNQIRLYGENDELVDSIISLSHRYGIITPYTSFLVDGDVASYEEAADAVRQTTAAPPSGANAVAGSSSLKALSEADTVQRGVEGVRIIDDRTYFFREDVWIDSEYSDHETLDIAIYSDAFFELLSLVEWIGPHLALGDAIILRVGEVFVHISKEGMEELSEEQRAALSL